MAKYQSQMPCYVSNTLSIKVITFLLLIVIVVQQLVVYFTSKIPVCVFLSTEYLLLEIDARNSLKNTKWVKIHPPNSDLNSFKTPFKVIRRMDEINRWIALNGLPTTQFFEACIFYTVNSELSSGYRLKRRTNNRPMAKRIVNTSQHKPIKTNRECS